jgi:predicted esterase
MRTYFLLFTVVSLLALVAVAARGDIIILNTGGRVEGKIIEEDIDKILVKTPHAMMTIPQDDVEEIQKKLTPWEEYSQKSTKMDEFDAEAHWKLAKWCKEKERENWLKQEYRTELELVLSLKPGHKEATKAYTELRAEEDKRLAKLAKAEAERRKKTAPKPTPKTAMDKTKPPAEGVEVPEIKPGERQEITLTPARKKKIYDLVNKFFDESPENVDARQKILAEIDKLGPIPKSAIKPLRDTVFKKCRKKELYGFERVGGKYRLKHKLYPGTFILGMPRGGGKRMGLLIGLHGGGQGVGDGATSAQKWSMAAGQGCITCFPTVIQKEATAWNKEREEKYVIQLIQELKRAYPAIDSNRIYLCGHSMGGFGTWAIGTHYADMFAAISPNAGGIFVMRGGGGGGVTLARGTVVNLKATPIYFYHGADDGRVGPESDRRAAEVLKELKEKHGPYEYVYKEYNGIGHGYPPGGFSPIIKWMVSHKRNPYPDYIVWEPSRPYKKLFWWIKVRSAGGQIIAKYKKSKNLIEIEGSSSGISVFLNDKMVNFSKPVKVMLNGKEVFNDFVYHSASAVLESIQDKKDKEQYFTAKIDL